MSTLLKATPISTFGNYNGFPPKIVHTKKYSDNHESAMPNSCLQMIQAFGDAPGLGLPLGSANWRVKMLEYVYRRAKAKGKIVSTNVGNMAFEYALIFTRDGYGRRWRDEDYAKPTTTYWLRDYVNIGACGTNIPGHAFVFGQSVPKPFRDHVGLHEHVESLGNEHIVACEVELTAAKYLRSFFVKYAEWLHSLTIQNARKQDPNIRGYFDRAIPDFTSRFQPHEYDPVRYAEIFLDMISQDQGIPQLRSE